MPPYLRRSGDAAKNNGIVLFIRQEMHDGGKFRLGRKGDAIAAVLLKDNEGTAFLIQGIRLGRIPGDHHGGGRVAIIVNDLLQGFALQGLLFCFSFRRRRYRQGRNQQQQRQQPRQSSFTMLHSNSSLLFFARANSSCME